MYENKLDRFPNSIVPFKSVKNPDVRRILFYLRDKELTLQRFIKKYQGTPMAENLTKELRVIEDALIWINSNCNL
jgi:hypothetical protein